MVTLRSDTRWSDGSPVSAHDVAFTFEAMVTLEAAVKLGGSFGNFAPPDVLAGAQALDDYPVGSILTTDVSGEPVVGAFLSDTRERGAFVDRPLNPAYSQRGFTEELFANGAVRLTDNAGHPWTGYGTPGSEATVRASTAPAARALHYRVLGSQSGGVLALQAGEVGFLFNAGGLEKGFEEQLRVMPGVTIVRNPSNSVRFLGFNFRRAPMNRQAFRQAIATLVNRGFVTERVLQGVPTPLTSIALCNARWTCGSRGSNSKPTRATWRTSSRVSTPLVGDVMPPDMTAPSTTNSRMTF